MTTPDDGERMSVYGPKVYGPSPADCFLARSKGDIMTAPAICPTCGEIEVTPDTFDAAGEPVSGICPECGWRVNVSVPDESEGGDL